MSKFENYYGYVQTEAKSFVDEYIDEAVEYIRDGNTDMHDFLNDEKIHTWVDNDFIYVDLLDSAHILDQSDNVETDWGLWEGQEPRKAIETQAFFTYRTDLYIEVKDLMEAELEGHKADIETELVSLQESLEEDEDNEELQEQIDLLETLIEQFDDAIAEM
jgi:hypothetical protein